MVIVFFAGEHPIERRNAPPTGESPKALTPLLEIRNLTKSFDGQHAVDDVSLTIYKGEIFCSAGRVRLREIDAAAHAGGL